MKQDRFHASDYTPSEVEAAKRVMIEVAQNLGEYADACVVVGGWVPELLLPDAEPKHTGSIDVDLALNPERLSGERYASLLEALNVKAINPAKSPGFRVLEADGCAISVDQSHWQNSFVPSSGLKKYERDWSTLLENFAAPMILDPQPADEYERAQ